VMEAGGPGRLFNRMDASILNAIVSAAHERRLPVALHTGSPEDIADAIRAGADSVEHGSIRQIVPEAIFGQMSSAGRRMIPL
jgi:imidazolonepropionase-like amidohydrolase